MILALYQMAWAMLRKIELVRQSFERVRFFQNFPKSFHWIWIKRDDETWLEKSVILTSNTTDVTFNAVQYPLLDINGATNDVNWVQLVQSAMVLSGWTSGWGLIISEQGGAQINRREKGPETLSGMRIKRLLLHLDYKLFYHNNIPAKWPGGFQIFHQGLILIIFHWGKTEKYWNDDIWKWPGMLNF